MYQDQAAKTASAKEATFNDRLNKVADSIAFQCERIESVLSRVNGTPQVKNPEGAAVPIRPMFPLSQIVENLENANQRLNSLATGVEKIA